MKNFPEKKGSKLLLGIFLATFGMSISINALADSSFKHKHIRNNADGSQTLTGHVPGEVKKGSASFKSHASRTINAQIILPLQNQSQLSSLLQGLYDSKSPNFHHFLTPTQFAKQFAPSTIDATFIEEFLTKEGISVTGQSPNGAVLYVTGPVASFEQAFGLHINNYQKSDGTMFFSPDADPTIPASLAGKILAIGGLDSLPKYQAHLHQHPMSVLPKAAGSGPGGFLAPNDVKTAYNLNSVSSTGSGQSVALFELDGYTSNDITAYESHFGLPNVPLQNVLIDGFSGTPNFGSNGGADEVTLDIELVAAFAPGSNILVYEAANTTQAWIDEWSKIASDNKAKVVSCSWGEPEMDSPTLSFDYMIFSQMAAQGQAVFVASGDNGAFDAGGNTLAVDEPASQPYVTAVGISALVTNSSGAYSNETASVNGGGGVSAYWSIPSYQTVSAAGANTAATVSTTMRNLPDVVLTADSSTAYAFYINGSWGGWWGSSLSSPIWASFISRVNQGLGQNGPIGSVNSALYKLAQSSSYANDFHDITTGTNGHYVAEPGFDDATGLGSFNGLNLYNDLVKNSAPSAPTGLVATAGNNQVTLTWASSATASYYNIKRSTVSGGPYTEIADGGGTSFTDNSVTNGTTYYYVVSAVNSTFVESLNSAQVSATPKPPVLPAAPVGLNATAGNAQVTLTWASSATAMYYNIKRSTVSGGPYTELADGPGTSFTDNSVTNGTTYYYVVSAVTSTYLESLNSVQVSATPIQLVKMSATAGSGGQISPSGTDWYTNYGNNVEFVVIPNAGYIGSLTDNGVEVTLTNNTYTVKNIIVPHTLVASFTLQAVPAAPAWVNANALANGNVTLTWAPSTGATSYNVKRATVSGGPYKTITNTTSPFYTDVPPVDGITYYYVVSGVNSSGEGPNTAQVIATPMVTPTGLKATAGNARVTLTWTPSAGATDYDIRRSTVSGGPYTDITVTGSTTFIDTSVTNGTTYYYIVLAVYSLNSATSVEVSATPIATMLPVITKQPVSVTAQAGSTATFSVVATGTPAPTYQWYSSVNGGPFTAMAGQTSASRTTGALTTDSNGNRYYCVVTNSVGSVTSNIVTLAVYGLPAVSITSPASGSSFIATLNVTITAAASETNGSIAKVSYYNGTNLIGTSTLAPYSVNIPNIAPGTYSVTAIATDAHGVSTTSKPITINVAPPLPPVTGLTATAGNAQVKLAWNPTPGATTYDVFRGTVSGDYINIITVSNPFYTDNFLSNGTTYYYVILAENSVAERESSAYSAQVSVTPGTIPVITTQPVSVTAQAGSTATFSVVATGTPAPTYQWYSSVNGGPFTAMAGQTSASRTTGTLTTANSGNKYECIVTNIAGSVTSNVVTLTVTAPPPEIIDDKTSNKVTITGAWTSSTATSGYYSTDYLHDGNALKGTKSVKYTPSLSGGAGTYQVYILYTSDSNRASNVPVDIIHSGTTTTSTVNQRLNGGTWVLLGTYNFLANGSGEGVTIRTTATNGYVIADAVKFIKQ